MELDAWFGPSSRPRRQVLRPFDRFLPDLRSLQLVDNDGRASNHYRFPISCFFCCLLTRTTPARIKRKLTPCHGLRFSLSRRTEVMTPNTGTRLPKIAALPAPILDTPTT